MTNRINTERTIKGGLGDFIVQLWEQGNNYFIVIKPTNPNMSILYQHKPPKFNDYDKALKALSAVYLREDGIAVYGHKFEDEG